MNARGQGTVYYDPVKDKWYAKVPIGNGARGQTLFRKRQANSKREAQAARRALIVARDEGEKTPPAPPAFQQFAGEHMEFEARNELRSTTWSGYDYQLRRFIYPEFGHRALSDITSGEITKFLAKLRRQYSASQVNYVRATMSRVFQAAVNHALVAENPVRRTKPMRKQEGDSSSVRSHWTLEECSDAVAKAKGTKFELFIQLAVFTGMRHGELLGLCWKDFDLDGQTVTVQRTLAEPRGGAGKSGGGGAPFFNPPKTAKGQRTLRLADDLINTVNIHRQRQEALRLAAGERWTDSGLVFTNDHGGPYWPSNHSGYFRKFLADNGLRPVRVHDLRHGFACNALELGVDLPSISRALGHASLSITMDIYGRGATGLENRATEGIAKYFSGRE